MKKMFEVDIGFSGHGIGFEGTLGAVALGANVIEKHVTLSKKMSGPDQEASLEFDEFGELIKLSRNIVKALGHGRKGFQKSEKVLHSVLSKRLITTKEVKTGTKITKAMVRTVVTKDARGLLPDEYYNLLSSKASKDLKPNHIICSGDVDFEL